MRKSKTRHRSTRRPAAASALIAHRALAGFAARIVAGAPPASDKSQLIIDARRPPVSAASLFCRRAESALPAPACAPMK
jgi:hypothetical protein